MAVSRRETNIRETANYLTFCFLEMANSTQARLGYFGLQGGERRLLSKQQLYNPGVERGGKGEHLAREGSYGSPVHTLTLHQCPGGLSTGLCLVWSKNSPLPISFLPD